MVLPIKYEVQQVSPSSSIFLLHSDEDIRAPSKIRAPSMGSMSPLPALVPCELRGKVGQKTVKCKIINAVFDLKCGEGRLNSSPMTK